MTDDIETPAVASAMSSRAIALLDKDFVLVGRVDNPSDADWDAASEAVKFPNGFDNALHRYKMVKYEGDKWRFEPVSHAKDEAAENTAGSKAIMAPLVRSVLGRPAEGDVEKLETFLSSFDSLGA